MGVEIILLFYASVLLGGHRRWRGPQAFSHLFLSVGLSYYVTYVFYFSLEWKKTKNVQFTFYLKLMILLKEP